MIRVLLSNGKELDFEADKAEENGEWLRISKSLDLDQQAQRLRGYLPANEIVAEFRNVAVDGWYQVEKGMETASDNA